MKKYISRTLVGAVVVCMSGLALADSTVIEVFTCELEDEKTIDEVQAANSKWLHWVNANGADGKVSSSVVTAIVGNNQGFVFVDSYPDLATWAAVQDALESDEGEEAVGEVFEGLFECDENTLHKSTPTT